LIFKTDAENNLIIPITLIAPNAEDSIKTALKTIIGEYYLDSTFGLYTPGISKSKFDNNRLLASVTNTLNKVSNIILTSPVEILASDDGKTLTVSVYYKEVGVESYEPNVIRINYPFNTAGHLRNSSIHILG